MSSVWNELHSSYQAQDWIEKPSIFSEVAIQYFPTSGRILELGAGLGQDSIFFAKHSYDVVSTDIEISSLELNLSKQPKEYKDKIKAMAVDFKKELPFEKDAFDIVYAHLSPHYFKCCFLIKIMKG